VVEIGESDLPEVQEARDAVEVMEKYVRENDGIDLDTYLEALDEFDQAFARLQAGDYRSALNGFRFAAAKNDRNAPTHGNLGLCLAKLGRKAEALAELNRAIELDPGYHPARANLLAVEQMKEGQPLSAEVDVPINFNRDRLEQEARDGNDRGPAFGDWMAEKWKQWGKRKRR
jgi:Flp pilus assembly protein TadD